MKTSILVASVLALVLKHVEASANCLSCKLNDMTAPLLVSYSYCNVTDACLENRWNYINMPCKPGGWSRGVLMSIDECKATESTTNNVRNL